MSNLINKLLTKYDKVMNLKIFIDSEDDILKNLYINSILNHNNKLISQFDEMDAGFDLFCPSDLIFNENSICKIDLNICCSAQIVTDTGKNYYTGYFLYPSSSISKTQLRLANSTGIIDSGYRGHIIGMFDIINNHPINSQVKQDYKIHKKDRYLQICAPGLIPIIIELVNFKEELGGKTIRDEGGFGSIGF